MTTTAAITIDRPTVTMPLGIGIQSAAAMLTSASKDDVTPVLVSAYFTGTELQATDRYKIARFPMPTETEDANDASLILGSPFLIPRDALVWASKVILKSLRFGTSRGKSEGNYSLKYERTGDDHQPGTVTVSVVDPRGEVERSQAFDGVIGNFPPVEKLFPTEFAPVDEPVGFNPDFMAVLMGYFSKYGGKEPFTLQLQGDRRPAMMAGAGATFVLMPNRLS